VDSLKKYTDKLQATGLSLTKTATSHRFVLLFIILGAAIAFALIRTGSYLSISRDQARYEQEKQAIQYQQIDKETLEKFRTENQDKDIQVDSNFDPDRNNPFTD
jgi:hypothetical protein